jgi:hypothetical protein
MRRFAKLLTLLVPLMVTAAAVRPEASVVNVTGTPPPRIRRAALEREYYRLVGQLADNRRHTNRPLTIIYYGAGEDQPAAAAALPEWGGGGAIGPDTILIPLDRPLFFTRNLHQVTVHEMVHSILTRAYPGVDIPRWFHEGCAMTLSGEVSFDEALTLARAVLLGRLMRFEQIDSVNSFDRARAELAYGQSHAAILFFIDKFGLDGIRELLGRARRVDSFEKGMHATLGFRTREFERLAAHHIRQRYGLAFVFGDFYLLWLLVLLLAGGAFVVTRIRNRRRARELDQHIPPEPTPTASPDDDGEGSADADSQPSS